MSGNQPKRSPDASPLLLTPGPLTTSAAVKEAMLRDYGARDAEFIELNRRICQALLSLCDAGPTHLCVPLQGSGSFAVEAMLANQLPREGKLLNFGERRLWPPHRRHVSLPGPALSPLGNGGRPPR